jgi:cbb3-type cytochrome c oxidase subunit III
MGVSLLIGYQPDAVSAEGDPSNGQRLFLSYCFICHGANGEGDGPYAPRLRDHPKDLTDSDYFSEMTDQDIFSVISKGGPASRKSAHMRPWGFRLPRGDIDDLVAYIRFLGSKSESGFQQIKGLSSAKIYSLYCVSCHGPSGKGDGALVKYMPSSAANLTDKEVIAAKTDSQLYRIIANGKTNDLYPNQSYMPSWEKVLTKKQIQGLINYIRDELAR